MAAPLDRWIQSGRIRAQLGSAGANDTPTIVIVGGLHGNEAGGLDAARQVVNRLSALGHQWPGRLYVVAGNLQALRANTRFFDRDLNRGWSERRAQKLRGMTAYEKCREDKEFLDLLDLFDALSAGSPNGLVLLDLHTTSGDAPPFSVITDHASNHHLARSLPMPSVLGFDRYVDEPILSYFARRHWPAIGIEGGRQGSLDAVQFLEEAVLRILGALGWSTADHATDCDDYACYTIRYRHAVVPGSRFVMEPGFRSFDRVRRGDVLASDKTGVIRSAIDGFIFLPLYQRQGADGFFLLSVADSLGRLSTC